jgi:hypothetical protein
MRSLDLHAGFRSLVPNRGKRVDGGGAARRDLAGGYCQNPVPPLSRKNSCHHCRCGSERDHDSSDSKSRQYWRIPKCRSEKRKFWCNNRPSGFGTHVFAAAAVRRGVSDDHASAAPDKRYGVRAD